MDLSKSSYHEPTSASDGLSEPPMGEQIEGMQEQLDKAARRRGQRPRSKYARVEALLLSWADDDLGVLEEVAKLEELLRSYFNFTAEAWRIPSDDAEDQLTRKILSFRKGKVSNQDLLILYYGGHAGGNSQECTWAARKASSSPRLNWHNVQPLLLGSQADILIILDCCFATLGAKNYGIGDNWFLGASAKESVTTGVNRDSFTSALSRELERCSHRYWMDGMTFTVQDIHSNLMFYERDLTYTPTIVRLTNHFCNPTALTPLSRPGVRPLLQAVNTEPPQHTSPQAIDPSLPVRSTPTHATLPSTNLELPNNSPIQIVLSPGESQTVRVTGLPLSVKTYDIIHWFSDRLGQDSLITKIGPIVMAAQSKITTITFASIAVAKRALAIRNRNFEVKSGGSRYWITIENDFEGLTCIYTSTKSPSQQPTVDLIFVHGSDGHAINTFACHYTEPTKEDLWPRDELPKVLEGEGIFPRIMTFGWGANSWLNPPQTIHQACDSLVKKMRDERLGDPLRPIILIGHGVGGLLLKQAVIEIVNQGFNEQHFENPVKSCFFFAVPHHKLDQTNGFAQILANMKSATAGTQPDTDSIRKLKARNTAISNLSDEFDIIRREYSISSISFNEERTTRDLLIVPKDSAVLDGSPGKAYSVNENYCGIMKLSMTSPDRVRVFDAIKNAVGESLGLIKEPQIVVGDAEITFSTHEKEKVYARLRRYDTVFLVDDSDSMFGPRWKITSEVLAEIASIAIRYDKDGVDLRFFNNYLDDEERLNLDSSGKVMDLFRSVQPDGPTLTADVLEEELNNYVYEYTQNRHKRGLNLIVLTDGEPDPGQMVEEVLVKYAKKLEAISAPLLHVGVQFVQIGGDEAASIFLKGLDDDLKAKHSLDRDVRFST